MGYRHDTVRKTIEIDPERALIVRQMFEQYATGKYSLRQLEVQAARQGLTSRRGYRMGRSSVAQILKNPFYIGDFLWSGKRYHGKHPRGSRRGDATAFPMPTSRWPGSWG